MVPESVEIVPTGVTSRPVVDAEEKELTPKPSSPKPPLPAPQSKPPPQADRYLNPYEVNHCDCSKHTEYISYSASWKHSYGISRGLPVDALGW